MTKLTSALAEDGSAISARLCIVWLRLESFLSRTILAARLPLMDGPLDSPVGQSIGVVGETGVFGPDCGRAIK